MRLKDLKPDELADLATSVIVGLPPEPGQEEATAARRASMILAADGVAQDPDLPAKLAGCADRGAELTLLKSLIARQFSREERARSALVGMGAPGWVESFGDRLGEVTGRVGSGAAYVASRALAEVRRPANDLITLFLGDVFTYINNRGMEDRPGTIPVRVMGVLTAAISRRLVPNEPLVVISHSMGGQIVYDLVTHFLPRMPADHAPRVDFWCAAASQVGLFEEMKLFLASKADYGAPPKPPVPYPDTQRLGGWWNAWDYNDFISYTVKGIIAGVDDEPYDSGMSVISAHGGYFEYPSFYHTLARKLQASKARGWRA
jgi:hypothetical protein